MSAIWAFDSTTSKHSGQNCLKTFGISLRKHAADVINLKEETDTINRKRTIIASKRNALLHLCKTIHTKNC